MSGIGISGARGRGARGLAAVAAVLALASGCQALAATPDPVAAERDDGAAAAPDPSPTPPPPARDPSPAAKPRPGPVVLRSGAQGDQVRELQARLRQLDLFDRSPTGYYGSVTAEAVAAFRARQHLPGSGGRTVERAVWSALASRTTPPTHDELHPPTSRPIAAPDPRCLTGRVLCVSKKSDTLAWMIDGKVLAAMDVRFGSQYSPTREGSFTVYFKSRHHVSTLYDTPMPYAMFFSGGQAVHYSADFAARGYNGASHGCVNVRDHAKIAALFDHVRNGDSVVIYR